MPRPIRSNFSSFASPIRWLSCDGRCRNRPSRFDTEGISDAHVRHRPRTYPRRVVLTLSKKGSAELSWPSVVFPFSINSRGDLSSHSNARIIPRCRQDQPQLSGRLRRIVAKSCSKIPSVIHKLTEHPWYFRLLERGSQAPSSRPQPTFEGKGVEWTINLQSIYYHSRNIFLAPTTGEM